jgi:hypothetical protein
VHPLAPHALPVFIPSPDGPDYLMIGMAAFLLAATFGVGLLYWRLHALPEHIAHKSQKVQFQIVCVLALLAMFTHMHIFWVAGLLLALIDLPDYGTSLRRISAGLDRIANVRGQKQAAFGRQRGTTNAQKIPAARLPTPESIGGEQCSAGP